MQCKQKPVKENDVENDVECESFTIVSIDSLTVYENKYYLQALFSKCAYKIHVNKKQANDRLS